MTIDDPDTNGPPEVTTGCEENSEVRVRFFDRRSAEADNMTAFAAEVSASGLQARLDKIVVWDTTNDLAGFLDTLAADFRGWEGERSWRTIDHDLRLSAEFRSSGHVGLTWTLHPWRTSICRWNASVTTWLEAGEQITTLAVDMRNFLYHPTGN